MRDLGRFADRSRFPNAAVVLVIGASIVVRVPLTDNARFLAAGWTCLRESEGLWTLDTRDPEYARKRRALADITSAFADS